MREKIAEKFYKVLAILTAIMVICAIIAVFVPIAKGKNIETRPCYKFNTGWTDDSGKLVDLHKVNMNYKEYGSSYSFERKLPKGITDNVELMFQTQHTFIKVYVDGKRIYEFKPQLSRMVGKSYGTKVHYVNLGDQAGDKEVQIIAKPIYDDNSACFEYVALGNSGAYISKGIRDNIGSAVLSLAVIFLSLLVILLSGGLPKDNRQKMSMLYLATLGIAGSLWVFLESRIFPLIFIGSVVAENIDVFMILVSAYASVGFVYDFYEIKSKFWIRLCVLINFATVSCMLLFITIGYCDYHELLYYVQGIAMLEALFDVVLIVKYSVLHRRKANMKNNGAISFAFFIIVVSVFYTIFKYAYLGNSTPNSSKVMGTALFILMVIMLIHYNREIDENSKKAIKAETFEKMAYTDELTGIENRAAYYRSEMLYKEQVHDGDLAGLMIINMDLNNLKLVNDIYGHEYGDKYLTSASEVIRRSFSKMGKVFRVGGDEFIALVPLYYEYSEGLKKDEELIVSMLTSNQKLVGRRDGWEEELSIAYGIAYYFGDEEIEEARRRADKAMYKMKNRMKMEK
ncbi:MAG: GGDEF domain-containing protein [Lachnospiraceae bacterium]|nr:GGDEF domain-containing protein [Lachnospiraceae bacterium]